MRFLSALAIAALLLGSVAWCQFALTRHIDFNVAREVHGPGGEHADHAGEHRYRLDVTTSFNAAHDPFALRTDDGAKTVRLRIKHGESVLKEVAEDIARGTTLSADDLAFSAEQVRLFVEATPEVSEAIQPCALRLRLYRDDGALCHDETLWSEGGGAQVVGSVTCGLEPILASVDRGLGGDAP